MPPALVSSSLLVRIVHGGRRSEWKHTFIKPVADCIKFITEKRGWLTAAFHIAE